MASKQVSPERLPELAMARPGEAVVAAHAVLNREAAAPADRIYALQALGIALRDAGRGQDAIRYLQEALATATAFGIDAAVPEVASSLGVAYAFAGRATASLNSFATALARTRGAAAARVRVRKSAALLALDRPTEAEAEAAAAARVLRRSGDSLWESRALSNQALALSMLGRTDQADSAYRRSEVLLKSTNQTYEVAVTLHSRSQLALQMGDLPGGLKLLDEAQKNYRQVGVDLPEFHIDSCFLLLAANLPYDALHAAEHAVQLLSQNRENARRLAQARIAAATAAQSCGELGIALRYARQAERQYQRLSDDHNLLHARLVRLKAQVAVSPISPHHVQALARMATALAARSPSLAAEAHLLAARCALELRKPQAAQQHLLPTISTYRRGTALQRATGWLAAALLADAQQARMRVLRACDRGLSVLETHMLSLGSTELRARATEHGRELAELALTRVITRGTGRDLLRWSERWRAMLHVVPPAQNDQDRELHKDLARLREAVRGASTEPDAAKYERQQRLLEDRIRRRTHTMAGTSQKRDRLHIATLLDALSDQTLVTTVVRQQEIHVVVARGGRVLRFPAGRVDAARKEIEFALFALQTGNLGDAASAEMMLRALHRSFGELEKHVLGPAVRALGDGPVVLVPPAQLHSVPWAVLPSLRERPVSVAASATAWLRAFQTPRPRRKIALVAGPGLQTEGAEVHKIASGYPAAMLLIGADATASGTLKALQGASLAHIAAHGVFRGDNPLFSTIELADGPLMVYDIERLRRPPYRLILSACESGVGAPTGVDELLGLASTLSSIGTAGVLASVVPVNDSATVAFSVRIHDSLRRGGTLAHALLNAREAAGDDPVEQITASAFLAFGAA